MADPNEHPTWDQIVTAGDVQSASLGSASVTSDEEGETIETILDVQRQIESFLGQSVIIHSVTQGLRERDWLEDEVQDDKVRAWANDKPVVEVTTADVSARFDGGQLERDNITAETVDYFAGYRRRDQVLDDLPTGSGDPLDGLTIEPPALPADIRQVATRLVLFYMTQVEHGAGLGQVEQAVGQGNVITVSGPQPGFVQDELRKLTPYQASPIQR